MSIASEITRLQNAKADIKTAIESKGVEVPSSAKLDSFDTYIENIQNESVIDSLTKLNEKSNELVEYLLDVSSTYESGSSETLTLYTPDETCECYIIAKKSNNMYCIYWIKNKTGVNINDISSEYTQMRLWYPTISQAGMSDLESYNDVIIMGNYVPTGYYSNDFNTLEQCLQAIQLSTTTYTSISNYPILNLQKDIPYSNTFVYDSALDELIIPQKISSNEIIQTL